MRLSCPRISVLQLSEMEALVAEAECQKKKTAVFEGSPPLKERSSSATADNDSREQRNSDTHASSWLRPPAHKHAGADW